MAAVVGSAQNLRFPLTLPVATGKLPLSWVVVQTLALPTEEDCLVPDPASCPQFSVCLGEAVWSILPPPMVG